MKSMFALVAYTTASIAFASLAIAAPARASLGPLPAQPVAADHPGSATYGYQLQHESFESNGRSIELFAPQGAHNVPLVVFGHGQATPVDGYVETLEHLAKKGVAVAFVEYDNGFFDQDWGRMAHDYMKLAVAAAKHTSNLVDLKKVIFAGHSKGAYIAGMAAGLETEAREIEPAAVILFAPAGYDEEYLRRVNPATPVTLVWGDQDGVIKQDKVRAIYDLLTVQKKQFIKAASYSGFEGEAKADHFFILSHSFFFGGHEGVTPLHYFGAWKWILGAAYDLNEGAHVSNSFIYGEDAASTGADSLKHSILRNY